MGSIIRKRSVKRAEPKREDRKGHGATGSVRCTPSTKRHPAVSREGVWRQTWSKLARSIAVIAAVGAAVGGLVGYWNAYEAVRTTVLAPVGPAISTAPVKIAGPPPRSIMVLPFSAPARDAQLSTLADTLGGDVARALANSVRDANIVPPSFAATQKEKHLDERELAHDANVRYLVAADVRRVGDDIAVTARLIDGTTAKQLASERRSIVRARVTQDQDLLAARVTAAARLMFQNAEGRRIAAAPVTETDAQGLVARADAIFTGEDRASTLAARKLYERARDLDPSLVAAWTGHMWTLDWEHWNDLAAGRNERLLAEMDRDSHRAIALDDRDPMAWFARASALAMQWQWQAAFEANDRALALDPTQFRLQVQRGQFYYLTGRSAEALQEISKRNAALGAPDSYSLFFACHAHIHLGQYEEALADCGRAVADTNYYFVYFDLTAAYAQTGDMVRAKAAKAELMRRVPDFTIARFEAKQFSNNPVWVEEVRTRFIPGLRKAGIPEN